MTTNNLSTAELLRRVDAGESFAEIAKDHGISRQAVQKRIRKMRGKTTKTVVVKKIEQVVDRKLDAVDQLMEINKKAMQMLDDADGNPELCLKCMSEIRGQLKLQLEIYATLYDMKAVAEFQEAVLKTIGETAPDVRAAIIHQLNQKRAIRSAVRFT